MTAGASIAPDGTILWDNNYNGDDQEAPNGSASVTLSNVTDADFLSKAQAVGLGTGFGNGEAGQILWATNQRGEAQLKVRGDISLPDPVTGETTNPGGGKQSVIWTWGRRPGSISGAYHYTNIDYTNTDVTTIDAKHSTYAFSVFSYNRQQAGTKVGANGGTYWPQEVGPISARGVTAAGNPTGKTEGAVIFVDHEDATAGGKLVALQLGATPKDADPGRNYDLGNTDVQDDDGDGPSGTGATYLIRANFAGEVRGNTVMSMRSGKKLGFNLPYYNGVTTWADDVYRGDRDATYVVGVDDPLPGRFIGHQTRSAINAWGWFGSGNDDPQFHMDVRTTEPSEILTFGFDNADYTLQASARTIAQQRYFARNSVGELQQAGPGDATVHLVGTEFAKCAVKVLDSTDASEDGAFVFSTMAAGSFAERVTISDGIYVGSTLGINASGKLTGSIAVSVKAAITAASDVATLKTALLALFA